MTEGKEREPIDKIRRAPRGWAWYISRAKAIAVGDLMDVTQQAREAGIGCPVAVTPVARYEGVDCGVGENEAARLRHLLDSLRDALPLLDGGREHVEFPVKVADKIRPGTTRVFHLDAFSGTGDDGEPVITVKFPCERYYWDEDLPLAQRIHDALAGNERPDDEGIVACLLETPEHHAALRHAVRVDGATVEHLAGALWCGHRLRELISSTNPHRAIKFRTFPVDDT
jgi:hypothetical protein